MAVLPRRALPQNQLSVRLLNRTRNHRRSSSPKASRHKHSLRKPCSNTAADAIPSAIPALRRNVMEPPLSILSS